MSCPYRFIFGVPEKGFHAKRLFGFALGDTLGTIGLALIVTYFFKVPVWKSIVGMFVLGEVLHYAFGVQTAFLTAIRIKAC
jgi:hypothetical protein